ncbi:hypothetical protein RNJ44_03881 [Nakaseomyces bracarensis]|uniref:Uncharacterized protein n=1 Tax=Nakaseomyces bracarensis TaxID=273131 RepID=A0ABR4NY74_9SACH
MSQDEVGNKRIYDLRKRNFSRNLVFKLGFLGYLIIVLKYMKYGTNFFSLLFRCLVQALLLSPFPDKTYSQFLINRTSAVPRNMGMNFPGSFPDTDSNDNSTEGEQLPSENQLDLLKRKIRAILFNMVLPVNIIYILMAIVFPTNFFDVGDGVYLDKQDEHRGIPSPFIYGKYMLEGERRGGATFQIIGDSLPNSNLSGNLGIIFFEFLTLVVQYVLFCVTCVNFGELDHIEDEDTNYLTSDGYDGNVHLTVINLHQTIDDLLYEKLPYDTSPMV